MYWHHQPKVVRLLQSIAVFFLISLSLNAMAGDGKLIATPGVTQFEGAGGGGIVPWAMLAGYAASDEVAVQTFATGLQLDDFDLKAYGVGFNFGDHVELTVARQQLDVNPLNIELRQNVFGAKVRLYGDAVYSRWPQVSLGIQHKRLLDRTIPLAVGADDTSGTDVYLAISKIHLGAVAGYNLLWAATLRSTNANQTGFLGFGGDKSGSRSLEWEASLAVLFSRNLAIGMEYRHKPNNLSFAEEQHWKDIFIAWVPNKKLNITAAFVDAGDIAGQKDQDGAYLSITGYLH